MILTFTHYIYDDIETASFLEYVAEYTGVDEAQIEDELPEDWRYKHHAPEVKLTMQLNTETGTLTVLNSEVNV